MIGDDENPGTPTAAPPAQVDTPAASEPAAPVSETTGGSEAGATPSTADTAQAGEDSRTLHLAGDPQRRRRRRRRRRPGPKPEGATPEGAATAEAAGEPAAPAAEGDKPVVQHPPRRVRVEAIAAGGEFSLAAL